MSKYVVIELKPTLYTVGQTTLPGWDAESDHRDRAEGEARAAALNAGQAKPGDVPTP